VTLYFLDQRWVDVTFHGGLCFLESLGSGGWIRREGGSNGLVRPGESW